MKFCFFHKYLPLENNLEICIKCGKYRPEALWIRWAVFKLELSCRLWDLRGLQTCPIHGFHAQSWFTGYCKKCQRKEWTKTEIETSRESLKLEF